MMIIQGSRLKLSPRKSLESSRKQITCVCISLSPAAATARNQAAVKEREKPQEKQRWSNEISRLQSEEVRSREDQSNHVIPVSSSFSSSSSHFSPFPFFLPHFLPLFTLSSPFFYSSSFSSSLSPPPILLCVSVSADFFSLVWSKKGKGISSVSFKEL